MVMELVRNLYGVPSAPRRWHMEIHNMFLREGFIPSSADPCLFIKGDLRVVLFVDDCLTTFTPTQTTGRRNTSDLFRYYNANTNYKTMA
jgi:hypothetical protein